MSNDVRPARPELRFNTRGLVLLLGLHVVAVVGPVLTGVGPAALALCAALYALRVFGIGAGYHRYFAHRSFETGPAMRAVLAFLSLSTLQRSVLWWAGAHRDHHRFSDTPADRHSPRVHGAVRAHLTWSFWSDSDEPVARVHDLERFPEVVWLDRHSWLPFAALAVGSWALLGWQGVIVGLVWSTLLVYHATAAVNSLAHVRGWRRYETRDDSRNSFLLALVTFGEGWHNNHHHYPGSCRQGFFWWEIDLTWLALRLLEKLGLVWNLREPPAHVRDAAGARSAPTPRPLPEGAGVHSAREGSWPGRTSAAITSSGPSASRTSPPPSRS